MEKKLDWSEFESVVVVGAGGMFSIRGTRHFNPLWHHNGFAPICGRAGGKSFTNESCSCLPIQKKHRWWKCYWKMSERNWEGKCCRGRWRVWLWQCSPGGLWDCLSEAIPSMGGLIRFITSQISGGACCQIELSAWPVIRASNEDRASLRPGTAQMTPRPGSVSGGHSSTQMRLIITDYYVHCTTFCLVFFRSYVTVDC